jgi:hypothetical protein
MAAPRDRRGHLVWRGATAGPLVLILAANAGVVERATPRTMWIGPGRRG